MFHHHIAHAAPGRLLWFRDLDGLALFDGITRAFPELIAASLMPDHVHLILPHADPDNRLHRVYAGYAHGLCVRRGLRGPLFAPRPPPVVIPNETHLRRTVRYVHLNPCRNYLVRDPLAWLFSTHRDMVGLVARPVVAVVNDPAAFHRFVSADDTVNNAGSALPLAPYERVPLARLASAVARSCASSRACRGFNTATWRWGSPLAAPGSTIRSSPHASARPPTPASPRQRSTITATSGPGSGTPAGDDRPRERC